jgi:hypothetical protein
MRKDLAIGLSLANICLIGIWADLLPFLYLAEGYPIGAFPCPRDFIALVLNVLWLAGLLAVLGSQARKWRGAPLLGARAALVATVLVALNAVRMHFNTWPERWLGAVAGPAPAAVVVGVGLLAAVVVARRLRGVSKLLQAALLIILPLAPIMLAQAVWASVMLSCGEPAALSPVRPAPADARRVVWIVFDELEQRALFERRPGGVDLPAFDRLRRESLAASEAQAPGTETERSIPSFLTGRAVARALVTGPNRLFVQFEGSTSREPLDAQPTLFSRARMLGMNTALAGWFIPYCSIFAATLSACSWEPCVTCGRRVGTFGASLVDSMVNQLSELAPRHGPRHHIESYRKIRARALDLAAASRYQFVFLHFPVPHDPWIYDGTTHELTWIRPGARGYFDNLVLADDTLAAVRQAMEQAGTWDRTHVVVIGDHGWRKPEAFAGGRVDHRVPLLVKVAGETGGATFDQPVAALAAYELTLGLFTGEVRTVADARRVLERASGEAARSRSGVSAVR